MCYIKLYRYGGNGGMMKKKYFYNKKDVMEMLGAPERRAKKIIDDLNEELKEKGFLIYDKVVNAKYFNERYNIE